jgi:hypothetical protein
MTGGGGAILPVLQYTDLGGYTYRAQPFWEKHKVDILKAELLKKVFLEPPLIFYNKLGYKKAY